jgi:alkanesulfonate monooxygenase SsuD/methylene tetrahydromethanopterin reductase-like flavin-dependent oxidoreductase (luciferase family)
MDVGLWLTPQAPAGGDPAALATDVLDQARAAREAGLDLLSTGQHYCTEYVQLQLVPLLSRLTAVSGDMTVASGVVLLPLHHPVEIAEQFATLDALADGPVVCGVGAGYRDREFDAFDVPKRERAGRLREGIDLLRRLWTEESVTFAGEHYAVEDVGITPRPSEAPPVWVAANARPAVERAARIGDAWFVNPHASLPELREAKDAYDAVRAERGAGSEVPVFREVFVAPTTEEAVETARPYLASKYDRYLEWGQDEAMDDPDSLHGTFEELAADRFLLGTPAEVAAEAERYREELDASHLVCRVHWPGMDTEAALECIELLGDEVRPAL